MNVMYEYVLCSGTLLLRNGTYYAYPAIMLAFGVACGMEKFDNSLYTQEYTVQCIYRYVM